MITPSFCTCGRFVFFLLCFRHSLPMNCCYCVIEHIYFLIFQFIAMQLGLMLEFPSNGLIVIFLFRIFKLHVHGQIVHRTQTRKNSNMSEHVLFSLICCNMGQIRTLDNGNHMNYI